MKGFGIYIHFVDLEQSEQSCKNSATGLMRNLISLWYSNFRLAACSATSGINSSIRTAIFSELIIMILINMHYRYIYITFPSQKH